MVDPLASRLTGETERVGFEPTLPLRANRFSRPAPTPEKQAPNDTRYDQRYDSADRDRQQPPPAERNPAFPVFRESDKPQPPELAEVAAAWTMLPPAIRAGVLALVRTAVATMPTADTGVRAAGTRASAAANARRATEPRSQEISSGAAPRNTERRSGVRSRHDRRGAAANPDRGSGVRDGSDANTEPGSPPERRSGNAARRRTR
ncbi:hypothetical protein RAS1_29110 [Phycisphaerae bacterium RAS1]|nr:hypothetical protein RAS1_29110 [Phycisphaerae bacterium RAS1]